MSVCPFDPRASTTRESTRFDDAIKESEQAKECARKTEEGRIAAERAAIKGHEQAEEMRKTEEDLIAAERDSNNARMKQTILQLNLL